MIHIVLYCPEIPNNTGAIIRLCANTGAKLHLIKPLGFELDDKKLRRAGLDYHEYAELAVWEDLGIALDYFTSEGISKDSIFAMTSKTSNNFFDKNFARDAVLLFGPESVGLSAGVLSQFPAINHCKLPMQEHSRSLNIANCVSISVYEVWRQQGFPNN